MLDACSNPDLITQITLQPVHRYGVDAAILFSDIIVPLRAAGLDVDIRPGVGPVISKQFRHQDDVAGLRTIAPGEVAFVGQAVSMLAAELGGTPLIGFAGGPFTLACYLVEGGPSKTFDLTRSLMYARPELWAALLGRLADIAIAFLRVQIEAGAAAFQLFDSWAGIVSPEDYRRSVLPFSRRVFAELAGYGVPGIHFGVGTGELLGLLSEAGADVIGVDWRVPLDQAWERIGDRGIQGNLDPALLLAPQPELLRRAGEILAQAGGRPGHIFNLGHGVLPDTPPDNVAALVDYVHVNGMRER